MSRSQPPASTAALHWHAPSVLPALVPGTHLNRTLLESFVKSMQAQGMSVQMQRMRYDRLYAHERLCRAHGQGDAALREMALQLFDLYHAWPEDPA